MTATLNRTDPIFTDENAAREYFEAIAGRTVPVCPHCGSTGKAQLSDRSGSQRTESELDEIDRCNRATKPSPNARTLCAAA